MLLPGDYSAVDWSVTKSAHFAAYVPTSPGIAGMLSFNGPSVQCDDVTVSASKTATFRGIGVNDVSLAAGATIEIFEASQVTGPITNSGGTGIVAVVDSQIDNTVSCSEIWARNAQFNGEAFSLSGTRFDAVGCFFGGASPVITFTGSAGVVRLDAYSRYWFEIAGGSVVNGTIDLVSFGGGGGIIAAHRRQPRRHTHHGRDRGGRLRRRTTARGVDGSDILTVGSDSGDAVSEIYSRALTEHRWFVNGTEELGLTGAALDVGTNRPSGQHSRFDR